VDSRTNLGKDGQAPFSPRADDAAFATLTSRGESQAARELASSHVGRLRGFLNANCASDLGGPLSVEELIQETIELALQRAKTYRPEQCALNLWLFMLGRDLALDRVRSDRKPVEPPATREEVLRDFCEAREELPGDSGAAPTRKPRWTKAELDQLRELYPKYPNIAIARELERSLKSVVSKAHIMGLKKDPARLTEMGRQNVSLRNDRRDQEH
jgi:DNA-directed RNA polymerase specialized sigma24 family protein